MEAGSIGGTTLTPIGTPYTTHPSLAPGSPPANFPLAPGIERSTGLMTSSGGAPEPPATGGNPIVLNYVDDFPELPIPIAQPILVPGGAWNNKRPLALAFRSSTITQVFHLPSVERRHQDFGGGSRFGEKSQEQEVCNDIAAQTNTSIELSESKDQSLTIVVTGKRPNTEEARKRIVQSLQTQAQREIRIPKDHHRVLIGREGKRLRELEKDSDCRIQIPDRDTSSETIRIIGPREGIDKALHAIQLISDEQSKLAQEHLLIPKIFYPWIRGPFNENIDKIHEETGVRINIPPPMATSEVIVVTGEKEGVYKAAALIKKIFEEKKASVKAVTCKVARAQHRFVIGQHRSGLAEILKETGVSVEVPPEEEESDTITLRGDPQRLGDALTFVYAKASSVISAEVDCPAWLHKFIIGQRGANIRQIIGEHPKVGPVAN